MWGFFQKKSGRVTTCTCNTVTFVFDIDFLKQYFLQVFVLSSEDSDKHAK